MNKAILFITFNRLDTTQKVFEQIKIAQPPRLYLASDGARLDKEGEKEQIENVRNWILNNIDWDCEVKKLFREENLGCGKNVSGVITWFFENEEDGIVLEDDCVPSQSFFNYCEELLDKYKNDKRIWHIAGDNPLEDMENKDTYYFAKIQHCWGWASWADRWKQYKFDLKDYKEEYLKNFSDKKEVQQYWRNILNKMKNHEIDTWDYQWAMWIVAHNGYCINPYKNLIKNIGFQGVHYSGNDPRLDKPTNTIKKINHPAEIKFNKVLVDKIYKEAFGINIPKVKTIKLLGFIPIYKSVKSENETKRYILGIPYSSYQDKGEYTVKRTFFQMLKKKKSYMYSKYCFLGIQFWCKKKSKVNILMDKVSDLQNQTTTLQNQTSVLQNMYQTSKLEKKFEELEHIYIPALKVHSDNFIEYKDIYTNNDVVIVASGPTMLHYNSSFMKDAIHIGVNHTFEKDNVTLDYLFIQDYLNIASDVDNNIQESADLYNREHCKKFYGVHYIPNISIPEKNVKNANAKRYYFIDHEIPTSKYSFINSDITTRPLNEWSSVVFAALEFALYTHPKRLFIVGCDCAPGHIHWENSNLPNVERMLYGWQQMKEFIENHYPDIEVISINPIGLKGFFKDVYTQGYINEHAELLKENIEIID